MNRLGEKLGVDGDPGPLTQAALLKYDVALVLSAKPQPQIEPLPAGTHMHPLDWMRGELGQREIPGVKDNPRIRWYHTHCANIGSKEHPDETPWCSSIMNACADECGMEKTDNALAVSWKPYSVDTGDLVEAGDIVVIGSSHVTMANKPFSRSSSGNFEGIGGNQSDACKVSLFPITSISAVRKWKAKPDTVTAPIRTTAGGATGGVGESTR